VRFIIIYLFICFVYKRACAHPCRCATTAGISTFAVDGQEPFVRLSSRLFDNALKILVDDKLPAWFARTPAQDVSVLKIDARIPEKTLHGWITRATGAASKPLVLSKAGYAAAIAKEKEAPGCGARRALLLRVLLFLAVGALHVFFVLAFVFRCCNVLGFWFFYYIFLYRNKLFTKPQKAHQFVLRSQPRRAMRR